MFDKKKFLVVFEGCTELLLILETDFYDFFSEAIGEEEKVTSSLGFFYLYFALIPCSKELGMDCIRYNEDESCGFF